MSGTRDLVPRFLSLLGPKLLTTLIAILSTPIIVRLLNPEGYGEYAVLLSIYSMLMIPISSAITEGVQKFVGEDRDIDGWSEGVIGFYLLSATVLVILGAMLLLTFTYAGYARQLFGEDFSVYFYFLVIFIIIGQFRALSVHTLLGFGLEYISGPLEVVMKLVTIILGILLVIFGLGVVGMLFGHIIANLVVAFIAGYVIVRRISIPSLTSTTQALPYRDFISFNILNVVLVLFVMSLFHIDVIMVQTFIDSEATGYYKAALALAEYIWIVPLVLQTLLLHSTSSLWTSGRLDVITNLAGRITRYTTLLVVLLAIGLAALAGRFVPLYYGEQFTPATVPLLLLIPGVIGFAIARPLQAICQGSGNMRSLVIAVGIAAALNIGLNALLIPRYGINGAAVATSISYGSMFFLLVAVSRQLGYDPLVDIRLARISLTAIISAIPIVVVNQSITNDIAALIIVPIVGFVVYSVTAILVGAIDIEEITELLGKLPIPHEYVPSN